MKKIILLLILIFPLALQAQKKDFRINSSVGDSLAIKVNGKSYLLDSNYIKIQTNYPKFDTLYLPYTGSEGIVCNFKPDSLYSIVPACCGSLDVIPSWKLKVDSLKFWNEDFETNFFKIQNLFMDRPFITFNIKNGTAKDSINAWYVDAACFPGFKLIDEKGWNYGVPQKCFYWSNISSFAFFKPKSAYKEPANADGIYENIFPYGFGEEGSYNPELASINTRIFDNDKINIFYDVKKKKIWMEYAEPKRKK